MNAAMTGVLTVEQYSLATAKLFISNRTFTALNAYDILLLCVQGDNWLQFGFKKYVRHLSHPNTEFSVAFGISLEFIKRVAVSDVSFGVVAEFLRHVVNGLVQHKDCPTDVMVNVDAFIERLLMRRKSAADYYPPAAAGLKNEYLGQVDFLKAAAREGWAWSQEPSREREIQVKVVYCGPIPQFVNGKPSAEASTDAGQVQH